ncbi:MAG TPA: HTH domain-containing protein [Actinomycetes bacterium]
MSTAEHDADDLGRRGTREQIMVHLRRRGRLSASQLADLLGLTSVGVRRHLVLLERDGLVTASTEKPRRGRPTAVYRLTDAGLETFPRHYDEIAREALAFLKGEDATAFRRFLALRNDSLAATLGARVEGATVEDRAAALAEVLTQQGYMAEVEQTPDGLRLCQHNCTVEHLASELPDLCASETKLFERLLGAPVRREATIARGGVRCVTQIDGPAQRAVPGARPTMTSTTDAAPAAPAPTATRSQA